MKSSAPMIAVNNLAVGYAKRNTPKYILQDLNFSIAPGKLVGLMGINGSGKSTLLRTLAHQQPKLKGAVKINNKPLEDYSINQWATTVSWVHTETLIPQSLSVFELVSLGRQPYTNWLDKLKAEDLLKIEESLLLTDLIDLKNKKCSALSDGQLQRVFIARAIAQDTPLILLDEPTTHLDLKHKVEILSLLKNLCLRQKKTILFSSHEIELLLKICDELICIQSDRTSLYTPEKLIASGILNTLFNSENIYFDPQAETYRFNLPE